MDPVGSTKLADLLNVKSVGEPVNVHVVESVEEPQPDFDAMQRMIEGTERSKTGVVPKRDSEE